MRLPVTALLRVMLAQSMTLPQDSRNAGGVRSCLLCSRSSDESLTCLQLTTFRFHVVVAASSGSSSMYKGMGARSGARHQMEWKVFRYTGGSKNTGCHEPGTTELVSTKRQANRLQLTVKGLSYSNNVQLATWSERST